MRILLHVLRELLVAASFTLGGTVVLALPAVAVAAVNKLPGVDISAVLLYLPLVLAGLLPYVLPLAFLLAVIATYGRLASDNEWTAIRMTGANPVRVLVPGLLMAVVLAGLTGWMQSELLPQIRLKQSRYLVEAMSDAVRELSPGRTDIQFGEFDLTARRRDGKTFVDALVHIPPVGDEPARNLRADRIDIRLEGHSVLMQFRNARAVVGDVEVHNGDMALRIDLEELRARKEGRSDKLRYLTLGDMRAELAAGATGDRRNDLRYEIHDRLARGSVFFVFLLLGAPTGLLLRRGNQLPALAAGAGYALAFYLLHMRLGMQLARNDVLPPELCGWSAIGIGLVAGLWMSWRALRQ